MQYICKVNKAQNKKQNKMKTLEIGTEIVFLDSKKMKTTATICEINDRTFTAVYLNSNDIDGIAKFYNKEVTFFLSGKKSHHRYTYGNVIEIIGKIN